MLKKYKPINYPELIVQLQTILGNRAAITADKSFQASPHVLLFGAGCSVGMPVLEHIIPQRIIEATADEIQLPTLLVLGAGVSAYLKLVSLLEATEGIGDYLSRSFIRGRLNPFIQLISLDVPTDDNSWREKVKAFTKSLRGLKEPLKSYVPIANLEIKQPLTIGRTTFHPRGYEREAVLRPFDEKIEADHTPPEEKVQFAHLINLVRKDYLDATCIAEVSHIGHVSTSRQVVYDIVRRAINLLRCYIPVLYGTIEEHRISLPDDSIQLKQPLVSFLDNGYFSLHSSMSANSLPYDIDERTLQFLHEKGALDQLSEILSREPRNQLEKALATAIWWIGTGNHLIDEAQQVVAVTTGLEALLIPPEVEEKTEPLAQAAAHLLSPDAQSRPGIHRRMKDLYGMRSEVVHLGRLEIPTEDLADLKYYALALLVEMVKHKNAGWTQVQDLTNAVKNAQFGVSPVSNAVDLIPKGPLRPPRFGQIHSQGQEGNFIVHPS
jgi:Apea-like HEPN